MKIGFYLDNGRHQGVDYSRPEDGNPGIGGTQYMIWLISCMLSKKYADLDVYLFADIIDKMPEYMKCKAVSGKSDALRAAHELGIDVFICRGNPLDKEFLDLLNEVKIKTIVWSHNFECGQEIRAISDNRYIKRNVCVSREQLERLRDTAAFDKSTYVYNTVDLKQYNGIDRAGYNPRSICYLGSLNREKGFHRLAQVWPAIEKRVPDAELIVLGSGTLYNKNARLGRFRLSSDSYEKQFMRYLTTPDGKIKPNVHFMGVVGGIEKLEIMSNAGVGVVNPTGRGETFCIGAIEFEALEVPVVTVKKNALIDTVDDNRTGLLFKNNKQFVENAVRLMTDTGLNTRLGRQGRKWVNEKFAIDGILERWHDVLKDVYNDIPNKVDHTCHNPGNNLKWLRESNRRLKKLIPFMPSVIGYSDIPRSIVRLIRSRGRK